MLDRNLRRSPSRFLPISVFLAILVLTDFASAQQLEEIIVTAQRREQNIQDVPVAVTAFSAEYIESKGLSDVSQLSSLAANVHIDAGTPFSGSTSVIAAYVRGIGQNDFAFNFDPGVGVYVDGVYLARTVGANVDLLDVERIEILKGPQGTLFGRNTIGGAVNIITRQPGDAFGYRAELTIGEFDRVDVRGAFDLPFSDTVKGLIAFSSKQRDGYQMRIPFPGFDQNFVTDGFDAFPAAGYSTSDTEGSQNEWNVRGKLLFTPSDRTTVTITADMTDVDQAAMANTLLATTESVPGPFAGLAANDLGAAFGFPFGETALDVATGASGFLFAGLYNFCIGATPAEIAARNAGQLCGARGTAPYIIPDGLDSTVPAPIASVNVDGDPNNNRLPYDSRFVLADPDLSYATGNSFSRVENWGVALTIEHEFSNDMLLKSITSYRDLQWLVGMDLDGSPLDMLQTSFDMPQKQWSQEFTLTGAAMSERLEYVLGAYYFHEKGDLIDHVTFPAGLLQIYGPNDLDTSAYAAFFHFSYSLTDAFSITVGGRYTEEDKKFEGFQHDLNGFNYKLFNLMPPDGSTQGDVGLGAPPFPLPNSVIMEFPDPNDLLRYFPPGRNSQTFDDFSPRIGAEYRPNDDSMVYASYAQGFKTGSWTTRLSNPLPAAPSFQPEEATTWELGWKSEWMDRRLRLNTAAFVSEYDGIQLNFQEGVSPTIRNAGNAEIKGIEIEMRAAFTDNFTLDAGFGYVDAEYTSVNPLVVGVNLNSRLPKTPETQINISPQFHVPLAGGASLVFNVDYFFVSDMYNDAENSPLLFRDDSNVLNGSATYRSGDDKWDIVLGGTNLTDERFLTTGQAQIAGGQIYGTYNRPVEWYLTFRVRGD